MSDPTQAPPPGTFGVPDPPDPFAVRTGEPPASEPAVPAGPPAPGIQRGLLLWLLILVLGGITSVALGHVEGALLFAGAGAFALAQASDAAVALAGYRRLVDEGLAPGTPVGRLARTFVASLVPAAGTVAYVLLGLYAWKGAERPETFAAAWCAAAAVACASLTSRRLADAVTRALFRGAPNRTRRLTARLVVMALLLPPPALQIMPPLLASMAKGGASLADAPGLVAQLLGELAIAFAGVGLFVRRDWRTTCERLGLTAMRPRDLVMVAAGLVGAIALNGVTEWVERHAFPALWQQDAAITKLIAGQLSLATSLLLGVSAGVGEEIAIRGALQPRLGIALSALVFACGHVQYSWFGMLTVGLLGMLLGAIRARTNTTTVIAVHALYDLFAVFTST